MINFFYFKKNTEKKELNNLADAVTELKEIAEIIFERIDKKIAELKDVEKRIDEKIKRIENQFIKEASPKISKLAYDKRNEIIRLYKSDIELREISKTLNIPMGEVELIVNLYKIKTLEK